MRKATSSKVLHAELHAAIVDLTKSIDITVAQMALCTKLTASIAVTEKAERAAEALRAAACTIKLAEQAQTSLVPRIPKTTESMQEDTWTRDNGEGDTLEVSTAVEDTWIRDEPKDDQSGLPVVRWSMQENTWIRDEPQHTPVDKPGTARNRLAPTQRLALSRKIGTTPRKETQSRRSSLRSAS